MAPRKPALDPPTANESTLAIQNTLEALNFEWDLNLQDPNSPDQDSPKKREESGLTHTIEYRCVSMIKLICRKTSIKGCRENFQAQAILLYNGWVHKPRAERGVVPEATRHRPHPVTEWERKQLLECLSETLNDEFQRAREISKNTPISKRRQLLEIDDSAVPWSISRDTNDPKRPRKVYDDSSFSRKLKILEHNPPPNVSRPFAGRSGNTSFTSTVSRDSIFSRQDESNFTNTQSTMVYEEEWKLPPPPQKTRESFSHPQDEKAKSSDYGSSFDPNLVAEEVVEDLIDFGEELPTLEKGERGVEIEEALSQDLLEIALGDESALSPKEIDFRESLHQIFCKDVLLINPDSGSNYETSRSTLVVEVCIISRNL